jgi:hypothetical protein
MKYKVIDILKTFSQNDLKRFGNFLKSPFFNQSEKLIRLYDSLAVFYPKFSSDLLTEENLSREVNPDLPFNKSTMKNLLADLSLAAENYLVQIGLQSNEVEGKNFLRGEFFKRNLSKYVPENVKKADQLLGEFNNANSIYFIHKFKIVTDALNYNIISKPRTNYSVIESNIELLSERARHTSFFFVKEMIRNFDNLLTFSKTFRIDKESNFVFGIFKKIDFEEVLKYLILNAENKTFSKIFEIYLALFLAFSKPENEIHYFKYKRLLLNNLRYLSSDEIRFHTGRLIRYCMIKSSEEKLSEKYDRELFNVYSFILENEYYKSSLMNYLPVELFRTILLLGLKLKKYKWTFEFIKKYKLKLQPERRENMYHYSCAEYYFYRGRYEEAMKSFHKVQLNHFMLKLDLKSLMLMTYYELCLFENALSLIDSYKHFLSNDKTLSSDVKNGYKNFISIIHKIIIFQTSGNYISKYKIEKDLNSDFPFKEWVREKIAAFDKEFRKAV